MGSLIWQKEESEIATTDATTTTEVLRRVEEENAIANDRSRT